MREFAPIASPLYEMVKTPLYELKVGTDDFAEEGEIVIATTLDPIEWDEQNYSSQDSTTAAHGLPDFSEIPAHDEYNYPTINATANDIGDWPDFARPRWHATNTGLADIYEFLRDALALGYRLWTNVHSDTWQWAGQWSGCLYMPVSAYFIGSTQWWENSVYAQRARFRCNMPVTVWWASAYIYNAEHDGSASALDSHYTVKTFAETGGAIGAVKPTNCYYLGTKRLQTGAWFTLPEPEHGSSNNLDGFLGRIYFAVHSETPAAWQTRTGITLGGL